MSPRCVSKPHPTWNFRGVGGTTYDVTFESSPSGAVAVPGSAQGWYMVFANDYWQNLGMSACTANSDNAVLLSGADYQELTNLGNVNETLTIGLIVLFALLGFALGYYFMGPRRRSLVEVV